ncbi:hypothetical protein KAX75_05505 [candidate division WOR-3 bacterium]|nr:hypothetical protein [candidate division WOR-3 bacterium]
MSSNCSQIHFDWKDCADYLSRKNVEVILTVFNIDFCESHKLIEKLGNVRAHELFEKNRDTIDHILNIYKDFIAREGWKGDGKVVIFRDTAQAISAAKRIIQHISWGNINHDVRIVISKGSMIFKKDVGRITSMALVHSERLHKHCEKNNIIVTQDIYDLLEPSSRGDFDGPKKTIIEKPETCISTYKYVFSSKFTIGKMKSVKFATDKNAKIVGILYAKEGTKIEEKWIGTNLLDLAKELFNKGEKVVLIEHGNKPIISALALKGNVDKGEIKKEKRYSSHAGYDVYWEQEAQFPHPIEIELGYDWILTIKW